MAIFSSADILLPKEAPFETWSVIACDQFTSQPEYWERVRQETGGNLTTYDLILPEAGLGAPDEAERVEQIHSKMRQYLDEGVFEIYPDSMIYVERTLLDGKVRKGMIGKIDLEDYDYMPGSISPIRATENTVMERIPPRKRVRQQAPLELSHILLLCDDDEKVLIEPVAAAKDDLPCLYDFDLMEGGGHIKGWLLDRKAIDDFEARLEDYTSGVGEKYRDLAGVPMIFAAGDGNHSLATAKACYEEAKKAHPDEDLSESPLRYALVELENIHDEALEFEPIHRIVTGVNVQDILSALKNSCGAENGYPMEYFSKDGQGTVFLDPEMGELAVGILQNFLDEYLKTHEGSIDYIHGDDTLKELSAADGAVGFLLPAMEKGQLFRGVIAEGVLPRKTFSMGHAREKRYYLEGRKLE